MMRLSATSLIAMCAAMSPASAESLRDALLAAYTTNPTLQAQRADLRAIDEQAALARAQGRLNVTASGNYEFEQSTFESGPNPNAPPQFAAPTPRNTNDAQTWTGSITADQPLFRGFRTWNSIRQADASIMAARANLVSVEQSVLLETVDAYATVIQDEAVVRLSENNVQVLSRQLEAAQDRFRVGEITRTDVAQAEARRARAQSDLIAARATLENTRATYARIVGSMPGTLESLPSYPELPPSIEDAMGLAIENNPELAAAQFTEQSSRKGVAVAKGVLLPTLSAQAQYAVSEEFILDRAISETQSVAGVLSIPLYQGGGNYASIRQAKQENSADRIRIVEARRQVEEQVEIAWENLVSARSVIEAASEEVRANEIAFEGVSQEAMVGSRTTLDVLDAEQELLDARVSLVRAERTEYVAAHQLLSTIGALTASGLDLDAAIYDPAKNYKKTKYKRIGWGVGDGQ